MIDITVLWDSDEYKDQEGPCTLDEAKEHFDLIQQGTATVCTEVSQSGRWFSTTFSVPDDQVGGFCSILEWSPDHQCTMEFSQPVSEPIMIGGFVGDPS